MSKTVSRREAIALRRVEVATCYLQGMPRAKIARRVAVSERTVTSDLKAIRREWFAASRRRDGESDQELELRKLDNLEREAWEAWQRSLLPVETNKISGAGADLKDVRRAEKTSRGQIGSAKFLEIVARCIDRRCAILKYRRRERKTNSSSKRSTSARHCFWMRIFSNIADIVQSTATPGSFACSIHPGRWSMFPHLRLLDRALTDIARGKLSRLVVQMPPRHGKSTLGSQFFPAWYLGTFPDRQVILTSATNELALDFSMAARDIFREHGPSVFGVRLRDTARARHRWQVEGGGGMRAAGVGGSIMGRGADLLIVDDYCKNVEEALSQTQRRKVHQWFLSTSSTRLSPRGAVVIIATRWHPLDLIGQLLLDAQRGGEAYHVIRLPALAEPGDALGRLPGQPLWPTGFDELGRPRPQFDHAWLEARRAAYQASGYEWMWNALYQQNPPETLDVEFRADYFSDTIWFDEWPVAAEVVDRVMALDPSLGASDHCDYSAFVMLVLDRSGILWVEADLDRRDAHRMALDAVRLGHVFNPLAFCVEANGFQQLLADGIARALRADGFMLPVTPWANTQNKVARIRGLAPYLARGEFRFRRHSPGTALLVEQLKGFPSAKHDDGPDALAMALELARERFFAARRPSEPTSSPPGAPRSCRWRDANSRRGAFGF